MSIDPEKSFRYLARLARQRMPAFVARPSKVRVLRRLAAAGHVDVRFYPPDACDEQFGEVRGLTPDGWKAVRGIDTPLRMEYTR
ncbi:hypothetical protein M2165_004888 [Variovorax sp. TBS-050B]|jgi:hypothetical protein|uniref:hypothetical protein n=1 Tax=Variovorax sp. TBS-050B TaxID=2940551 RepID=UPI002474F870|nr:hypothetical protein [Variovorax sp. TBS-050B]MDH6594999.1 hypothetical protein [Variovorax sp. TBS-050B]